jgi:hypothetical protein
MAGGKCVLLRCCALVSVHSLTFGIIFHHEADMILCSTPKLETLKPLAPEINAVDEREKGEQIKWNEEKGR